MEAVIGEIKIERYPAYKDSGVEWLGEVPEHWELTRLGTRFFERRTKVSDKDYAALSVTKQGILPQLDSAAKTNDGDNRKLVMAGDFVINSRSDRKGSSGISTLNGSVSLINTVLEPIDIHPTFCNYLLKSYAFVEEFYRMGHGIVADLWTTRYDEMKAIMIAIPSKQDQTAIANFLDRKTARIDKTIAQKVKLIELLKERRQILIHKAVTRGLNPDVPMKDSGVEWIGELPEHWEVKKIKQLFRLIIDPAPINNNFELLSIYTEIGVRPRKDLEEKGNRASTTDGYWFVKKGDFIVNKLLAWMGAIGLSEYEGVTSPAYDILRPKIPSNGNYYHELLRSKACSTELRKYSRGIMDMRLRLYFDKFGVVLVPYPSEEEQTEISAHIDKVFKKTEAAIKAKDKEIEKLKEYKATLINAAVTGKIKVS
ncbi:restriction endonuclease subunit S [Segetibacter aerophilus]|uniref:Restriction modification system DNA specificity domain-containing protein n=1 Tax=Segetibacter aerophilus TaxID=670293 RepID=A0A512BIJ0_9BACT|nr:restriction endonuclease subunit S [Segetibacter aerophilus]GEO11798.1 restriction modification system DNA specificity domain-containing protein [Segetibacter aerophilus]